MTVLLDLPGQIASALSSDICNITPYPSRQVTEGDRLFVGALEFVDGPLDASAARRKTVMYSVAAYLSVSPTENEFAERLLVQLCHGERAWHQRLRFSGINGVRPLDSGLNVDRNKDENNRLIIAVSATVTVEVAAFVRPTAT